MRKGNVLVFALFAVVSVLLLGYQLGRSQVDGSTALVIAVIWWMVIGVAVLAAVRAERLRRRRIRTVYVDDYATFNSERGLMFFENVEPLEETVAAILESLEYGFSRIDFPDHDRFDAKYFIRTEKFKVFDQGGCRSDDLSGSPMSARQGMPDQKVWKGEVVVIATGQRCPFKTPEELAGILAVLDKPAA